MFNAVLTKLPACIMTYHETAVLHIICVPANQPRHTSWTKPDWTACQCAFAAKCNEQCAHVEDLKAQLAVREAAAGDLEATCNKLTADIQNHATEKHRMEQHITALMQVSVGLHECHCQLGRYALLPDPWLVCDFLMKQTSCVLNLPHAAHTNRKSSSQSRS